MIRQHSYMRYSFVAVGVSVVLLFFLGSSVVDAETKEERRARLEEKLQQVERQILKQQVRVEDKRLERQSLERDLELLDAQIEKARLGIEARAVVIEQLGDQIGDKKSVVNELNERLERQRQSLAQLLRKTQEIDDYSLAEIMLGGQNLSAFFEDFESFHSIKASLNESVDLLTQIKTDTLTQKRSLEEKKLAEAKMKQAQEIEREQIEVREDKKEDILAVTKGQEEAYENLLESQQQTAAQLRAQLFDLLGGGGGIPLPQAVSLAQYAAGKTGVPAALILAILEQETRLGSNLGTCAYDDVRGGRAVMHPDRDQPVFEVLAKTLGFEPRSRQVSCPIVQNGERFGWGGAMGPSQFIPSTWAIYGGIVHTGGGFTYNRSEDVIRQMNGRNGPGNPYNNRDAFLATALLLRDNGATGGYQADRLAALRYYAGWSGATNPANAFYGDQVMNRKAKFEGQIKTLSNAN